MMSCQGLKGQRSHERGWLTHEDDDIHVGVIDSMRETGCRRHPLFARTASSPPSIQLYSSIGSVTVADIAAQEPAEFLGLVDGGAEDQTASLFEGLEGILMDAANKLRRDRDKVCRRRESTEAELEIGAMGGGTDGLEAGGIQSETEKLHDFLLGAGRKGACEEDLGRGHGEQLADVEEPGTELMRDQELVELIHDDAVNEALFGMDESV